MTTNTAPATAICGTCYGTYRPAERHDCTDPAQTGYAADRPAGQPVTTTTDTVTFGVLVD